MVNPGKISFEHSRCGPCTNDTFLELCFEIGRDFPEQNDSVHGEGTKAYLYIWSTVVVTAEMKMLQTFGLQAFQ